MKVEGYITGNRFAADDAEGRRPIKPGEHSYDEAPFEEVFLLNTGCNVNSLPQGSEFPPKGWVKTIIEL